jgi:predicted PurR-regulated permease PerM
MRALYPYELFKDLFFYAILLFGIGWIVFTYQSLLSPLVISCLIAYLLYPGVTWLSNRTRINRRIIVPIVYLSFLVTTILVVTFIAPIIIDQFLLLADQIVRLPELLETTKHTLERSLGFSIPIEMYMNEFGANLVQLLKPERIFRLIQGASTNIVWILITIIASFYLLRDWERLREWGFRLAPQHLEPDLRRLHQEIKSVWHTYLRGQLLIMAILGILSGIGAAVIGIPGALFLGFLAGSLALIPTLGPMTATIIAAILAWTQGSHSWEISNFTTTLLVVIIFQGIQLFEGLWLTPQVMGRRLNLHPGLVLIAIVGTLFTLGALMALIIIPLIVSFEIVFRFIRRLQTGFYPWETKNFLVDTDSDESFQDVENCPIVKLEFHQNI